MQRADVTIDRIQRLLFDSTGSEMIYNSVLAQHAGLYTELYTDSRIIFTVKEKSTGNAVLIFIANNFDIIDTLADNIVMLHYTGNSVLCVILTFPDESEATKFRTYFREYFTPNVAPPIPQYVHKILLEPHVE